MDFINNSRDILNIVIALSVLTFTIFVCWAIFYFAMIMRQGFRVVKETRERLSKIDEFFKMLKEKMEHSTSYLFLMVEGIKKLVELMKERKEKKGGKREK